MCTNSISQCCLFCWKYQSTKIVNQIGVIKVSDDSLRWLPAVGLWALVLGRAGRHGKLLRCSEGGRGWKTTHLLNSLISPEQGGQWTNSLKYVPCPILRWLQTRTRGSCSILLQAPGSCIVFKLVSYVGQQSWRDSSSLKLCKTDCFRQFFLHRRALLGKLSIWL